MAYTQSARAAISERGRDARPAVPEVADAEDGAPGPLHELLPLWGFFDSVVRLLMHSGTDRDMVPVTLHDVNSKRTGVFLLPLDGELTAAQAEVVAGFFRCKRTHRTHAMHPRVLSIVAHIAREYPGKTIEIVSGYRAARRESRSSPHRHARAVDLRVRGVAPHVVRDYVWSSFTEVGVGWYRSQRFVHVDYREDEIAWTQRRYNASYDYHPGWAHRARRRAEKARLAAEKAQRPTG